MGKVKIHNVLYSYFASLYLILIPSFMNNRWRERHYFSLLRVIYKTIFILAFIYVSLYYVTIQAIRHCLEGICKCNLRFQNA